MTTVVKYTRGLAQQHIESVEFNLSDSMVLVLTLEDVPDANDPDIITGQKLKVMIEDRDIGIAGMFVELDMADGTDLVRILQRLLRQMAAFVPPASA